MSVSASGAEGGKSSDLPGGPHHTVRVRRASWRADSGRARASLGKMGWSKKRLADTVTHSAGAHFQILPLGIQDG